MGGIRVCRNVGKRKHLKDNLILWISLGCRRRQNRLVLQGTDAVVRAARSWSAAVAAVWETVGHRNREQLCGGCQPVDRIVVPAREGVGLEVLLPRQVRYLHVGAGCYHQPDEYPEDGPYSEHRRVGLEQVVHRKICLAPDSIPIATASAAARSSIQ